MTLDSCDFGIDWLDTSTGIASKTHGTGVTFEGLVDESVDLSLSVASRLCVGEGLIGGCLWPCSVLRYIIWFMM